MRHSSIVGAVGLGWLLVACASPPLSPPTRPLPPPTRTVPPPPRAEPTRTPPTAEPTPTRPTAEPSSPPKPPPKPGITEVLMLRCLAPGPGKTEPHQCDRLPQIEASFVVAVGACTPSDPNEEQTLSFVIELDFLHQRWKVYRGKSSTSARATMAPLLACVREKMGIIPWKAAHRHRRYVMNVRATYPLPSNE